MNKPFNRLNALQQESVKRAARRQTTTVHDQAVSLVKEIGGTDSHVLQMSDDKTFHAYGTPKDEVVGGEESWPCEKGACFFVAQIVCKVATEQGCGKIMVHRSRLHNHEFDTATVLGRMKQRAGGRLKRFKTRSGVTPKNIGQMLHRANKATFDVTRPNWSVPIALSG